MTLKEIFATCAASGLAAFLASFFYSSTLIGITTFIGQFIVLFCIYHVRKIEFSQNRIAPWIENLKDEAWIILWFLLNGALTAFLMEQVGYESLGDYLDSAFTIIIMLLLFQSWIFFLIIKPIHAIIIGFGTASFCSGFALLIFTSFFYFEVSPHVAWTPGEEYLFLISGSLIFLGICLWWIFFIFFFDDY